MKHQKFLQIIGFLTFLGTFLPLKSQDLPNPIHSRKYYYNHFDYPLNGIRISTNNAFSKWLNEHYFEPTNISGTVVNIHQPWGHDSIQQIVKSFEISPFYCALSEVTNSEYQKFVNDDTSSFFKRQKLSRAWVYPDTNVWVSALTFNEPFVNYYFQHPAYSDFPVVGVSQFQATQYCNWLEDKLNAEFKGQLPEGYKIQEIFQLQQSLCNLPKPWQSIFTQHFQKKRRNHFQNTSLGCHTNHCLGRQNIMPRFTHSTIKLITGNYVTNDCRLS